MPQLSALRVVRILTSFAPVVCLVLACSPAYHDDPALIDVSDQPVTYSGPATAILGRSGSDAAGNTVLSWAGTQLVTRFSGSSVTAQMQLVQGQPQNFYQVQIDGVVTEIRAIDSSMSSQTFTATSSGNHTLVLTKMNEGMDGLLVFNGFTSSSDGSLLQTQTPTGRRIEYIGDSITCGYGNLGNITTQMLTSSTNADANSLRDCNYFLGKQVYQVSNGILAFGPQAANILSAESRQICWSGKGVYRNADNSNNDLMPQVWTRSVETDGNTVWDASQWIPQVVVIDLGTNDFGSVAVANVGGPPDVSVFVAKYTALVRQVRKSYPSAWIILAVGPMLSDYYPTTYKALTTMRQAINTVLGNMDDARTKYLEFPLNISSDLDQTGCEWHPDVAQDGNMANQLVAAIQSYTGWKL